MIIKQTKSVEEIKKVLCHPDIYDRISADNAPRPDEWVVELDGEIYLAGYEDDELIGIINIHPQNQICWEIHIQVLPDKRKSAHQFGESALKWVWANTDCRKLVAQIPSIYLDVIQFAKSKGFKVEGINEKSYLKYDVLLDQVHMGLIHG